MKSTLSFLLSLLLTVFSLQGFSQNASTVTVSGTTSTQNITNNLATVVDQQLVTFPFLIANKTRVYTVKSNSLKN